MVQGQANLKTLTSKVYSVVDGVCGDDNISELWASKLKYLLNSNSSCSGDLSLTVHSKISSTSLSELSVSDLDVCEALQRIKGGKKDTDNLSSDHLSGGSRGGSMGSMDPPFVQSSCYFMLYERSLFAKIVFKNGLL